MLQQRTCLPAIHPRAGLMFAIAFALAQLGAPYAQAQPYQERAEKKENIRRFAFIVGKEDGGKGRARLKYSSLDAKAVSDVLEDLGGLRQENRVLLLNPTRESFLQGMDRIRALVSSNGGSQARTELFVYYSGHSDETGLLLGDQRVTYAEFKRKISASRADVSMVILDSCASGSLTRIKGGHKRAPFLEDSLSKLKGNVVLTSSSAEELAQESDRIQGSYFTHHLVSGLRGAADWSADRKITLNEAYQYAYQQTLDGTQQTLSGAQHPSYSIDLNGRGELVMTDLRNASASLLLTSHAQGRYFIRDHRGKVIAEVEHWGPKPMSVGLAPGNYSVLRVKNEKISQAAVSLKSGSARDLAAVDFVALDTAPASTKISALPQQQQADGAVASGDAAPALPEPELHYVPAEFSVLPNVSTNTYPAELTHNAFSMSVLYARPARLTGASLSLLGGTFVGREMEGAQVAPGFNWVTRSVQGAQIAGGHNRTGGELQGAQIGGYNRARSALGGQVGGFNWIESELTGPQIGGFNWVQSKLTGTQIGGFNWSTRGATGAQIGGLNLIDEGSIDGVQIGATNLTFGTVSGAQIGAAAYARTLYGAQIGAFNRADDVSGVQIGAFNSARKVSGLQLGVINSTDEEDGVQLGLLNFPKHHVTRFGYGLHAPFGDQKAFQNFSFKHGGKYTYTVVQYGFRKLDEKTEQWKSGGLGFTLPILPFFIDFEARYARVDRGAFVTEYGTDLLQGSITPGIRLWDRIDLIAGATYTQNITGPSSTQYPSTIGYLFGAEVLF